MIGNNDIFDQEALLAIANDGGDGSSSSSCHSSTGSAEEENDSSRCSHSPFMSAKKAEEEIDSISSERKGVTVSNTNHADITGCNEATTITNFKQTELPPSNKQSETVPTPKDQGEENGGASSTSDDDSDDDDGFLESWFETENKKKKIIAQSTLKEATHEDKDIEPQIEESTNNDGEKNIDHGNKENTIELGASILRWISSSKKSEKGATAKFARGNNPFTPSNYHDIGGVVALQHNNDEQDDAFSRTSTLRLTTTPADNPRKRPRSRNESAKAILEDITSGSIPPEKMIKCGQVVHASDAERLSTPGAMVDCLARYDYQKGCYVLEIVDLSVNKLEPLSKAAHSEQMMACQVKATTTVATGATAKNSLRQSTELFDPRSIGRRAEDQLRKLKQGKGRTGTLKKRKKKQDDGLSEENNLSRSC